MRNALTRYLRNDSGNFAIMAAAIAIPLVMAAGLMVDLTTIGRSQAELQQAMDAAVLAVAREGDNISDRDAEEIVRNFLDNNYELTFANLTIIRQGTAVTIDATADAKMAFGGLFGYDDWTVAAASTADIAYANYEIALVLDTTGSMAGGKLSSMKDAVDGMIQSMSAQIGNKDRLKFSLVPFATFVNVGPEYGPKFDKDGIQVPGTGAPWLDLEGLSPVPQSELDTGVSRFQLYENMGKSWPGCVETRLRPGGKDYDIDDTAADQYKPETLFVPAFGIDEPDTVGYVNSYIAAKVDPLDKSTKARREKWAKYGVATDKSGKPMLAGMLSELTGLVRFGSDDDDDDDGRRKSATVKKIKIDDGPSGYQGFDKGPDFGCATQPITALTNDYNSLRKKVKALEARGTTNIMEGVAWGSRVLSPGEPFGQGQPKDKTGIEKIMVVLTDGSNVMGVTNTNLGSNYSSFGYLVDERLGNLPASNSATNAVMNERTLAACTYAKENGIELYTIRLEEPDVKTGTMLQQCASTPAHYFDAPSRSQLDEVFEQIKERVVRLRLAS
ncbi:MAG: pilus assembly protein TadG-related protein [Rhizobiaceae bacterium]